MTDAEPAATDFRIMPFSLGPPRDARVRRTAEDRADYDQMKVDGKIYGFPDDGDVFILYYRKDLFEDPKNREEFNW